MIPRNYEIRPDTRTDVEGDEYEMFNVYHEGTYLFSAFSKHQAENLISKREDRLQYDRETKAASAFIAAHWDSSYLKYPMTSSVSGMGRNG